MAKKKTPDLVAITTHGNYTLEGITAIHMTKKRVRFMTGKKSWSMELVRSALLGYYNEPDAVKA